MATEVTIPRSHRWIPKGMTVEYLHKATTDLQAIAIVESPSQWNAATELPVPVQVVDASVGTLVFQAVVRMWITAKR